MDSNTPKNLLDAATLMRHSSQVVTAAYTESSNQQPAISDIDLKAAANGMHHSQEMQTQVYGQIV